MNIQNFEFKAKVDDIEVYEQKLRSLKPRFKGIDHQIDTYFNVPHGRLKLRMGNIENALINYDREDTANSKSAQIILYEHEADEALKEILVKQLGVKVVVEKKRKIYFIENVKFHFDLVDQLGDFIEVEATDSRGAFTLKELKEQCDYYFDFFGLANSSKVATSYSDLMLELKGK